MITLPEVYTEAVISTAHITHADDNILTRIANEADYNGLHSTEYGYSLFAGEGLDTITAQLSPGCQSNLAKVFAAGITHLVIDRDGPVVDGLQSWEW